MKMRVKFINDPRGFFGLLFLSIFASLVWCVSTKNSAPNPQLVIIAFTILFGIPALLCIVWLILRTEIIAITDEHLICRNRFSKTVINFSDITEVSDRTKITYGIDGCKYECWCISDSNGQTVDIVKRKNREYILDLIKKADK